MSKVFDDVAIFTDKYASIWKNTKPNPSALKKYSRKEKAVVKKQISKSVKSLQTQLKHVPRENKTKTEWKNDLKKALRHRSSLFLNIENKEFENLVINQFSDTTEKYIDAAKQFDENCTMDDIMQSMRNVWIMNMIQAIANIEIAHTPCVFAYSMLYPCTDNFLDNPEITSQEKKLFNERLGERLEGKNVEPDCTGEKQIYDLIKIIESEYSRKKFPEVFDSIISIHKGQCKSLYQQDIAKSPKSEDILKISVEKGGTSVLADAYLVCGRLDDELSDLMFGFGFVLQLIDDLQDAEEDCENNHNTIFTPYVKNKELDCITNRLINFIFTAVDYESYSKSPYVADIKNLIIKNTLLLVFESIWKNKKYYSKAYIKNHKHYSPINFAYLHRKMKKVNKELKQAKEFF